MVDVLKTGLVNASLRGLTLLARFALLFYMARYLPLDDLGTHGLLVASVMIALYLVGLDYYVFTLREIVTADPMTAARRIREQLAFHGMTYTVMLPLSLTVFLLGVLPWEYLSWFVSILVFDHLSLEATRLLVARQHPVAANLILFLRGGAWVLPAVGLGLVDTAYRSLETIWSMWLIGSAVALAVAAFALRRLPWRDAAQLPVDRAWIARGIRTALPFLAGTAALIMLQNADRFVLKYFIDSTAVGIFVFFVGLATVVHVFPFSAVTMIQHPRIVAAWQRHDHQTFHRELRVLALGAGGIAAGLAALIYVSLPLVLELLGKQEFLSHSALFPILALGAFAMAMGYVPHYALYARNADRQIILATWLAFGIGLTLLITLVPIWGLYGAAWATSAGLASLGLIKLLFWVSLPNSSSVENSVPNSTTRETAHA